MSVTAVAFKIDGSHE